ALCVSRFKMSDYFWKTYTEQLVNSLTANNEIIKFTSNPAVIGAYAESAVTELIRNFMTPHICSTGSLIGTAQVGEKLKQLDLMIWSPTPLPAIFDTAGFALVPQQSVHGVIEIKRSAYSSVGKNMKDTLDWVEKNVEGYRQLKPEVLKFVQEGGDLNMLVGKLPHEVFDIDENHIALGIVCVKESKQKDKTLDSLIEAGRAVVLQEIDVNGKIKVNTSHVLHLLEYLKSVRSRIVKKLDYEGVDVTGIAEKLGEKSPGSLKKQHT
ncbi:DUF6602 domain-containing protein, partial [Vibrio artabrorum]